MVQRSPGFGPQRRLINPARRGLTHSVPSPRGRRRTERSVPLRPTGYTPKNLSSSPLQPAKGTDSLCPKPARAPSDRAVCPPSPHRIHPQKPLPRHPSNPRRGLTHSVPSPRGRRRTERSVPLRPTGYTPKNLSSSPLQPAKGTDSLCPKPARAPSDRAVCPPSPHRIHPQKPLPRHPSNPRRGLTHSVPSPRGRRRTERSVPLRPTGYTPKNLSSSPLQPAKGTDSLCPKPVRAPLDRAVCPPLPHRIHPQEPLPRHPSNSRRGLTHSVPSPRGRRRTERSVPLRPTGYTPKNLSLVTPPTREGD